LLRIDGARLPPAQLLPFSPGHRWISAWRTPGDPALYRALVNLSETTRRLHPRRFPAGVYKHRSIEEMNAQRDQWDAEHVARSRNRPPTN
jgi:hypothetical protein